MRVVSVLVALLLTLGGASLASARDIKPSQMQPVAPEGPLNTLDDVLDAVKGCWHWPPGDQIQTGMELTVRFSFKRSGEIFGVRISYQSRYVSERERALYYEALARTLQLCSPLPVTEDLGHAIAGRIFTLRFTDTRRQRKA